MIFVLFEGPAIIWCQCKSMPLLLFITVATIQCPNISVKSLFCLSCSVCMACLLISILLILRSFGKPAEAEGMQSFATAATPQTAFLLEMLLGLPLPVMFGIGAWWFSGGWKQLVVGRWAPKVPWSLDARSWKDSSCATVSAKHSQETPWSPSK